VCGWQVKLCDPLVTRGPYLSALRDKELIIKHYINSPSLPFILPVVQICIQTARVEMQTVALNCILVLHCVP